MQHTPHSRKLRQLNQRIREWNRLVSGGVAPYALRKLAHKIRTLIDSLRSAVPSIKLQSTLSTLLLAGGIHLPSNAQNFAPPVENPFGFTVDSTNYVGGICTADLDGDGDLDMLFGGYFGTIDYLENTGTPQAPVFSSAQTNPFGLTSAYYYAFITAADLDNDGDIDILAGEYNGNHIYYQNVGSVTAPLFTIPIANPFGLGQGSYISMPEFADLDNDGDFDVISGEAGGLIYFENLGTPEIPAFAASVSNPFDLTPNPVYFSHPSLGDLDQDGDLDVLIGETGGNLRYIQNLANANAPLFQAGQLNPFGIVGGVAPVILPKFVDIDSDGDLDILASGYEGSLWFYENLEVQLGISENALEFMVSPNPFVETVEVTGSTNIEELRIIDIRGKEVYQELHPNNTIYLNNLSSGIYIFLIRDEHQRLHRIRLQKQAQH